MLNLTVRLKASESGTPYTFYSVRIVRVITSSTLTTRQRPKCISATLKPKSKIKYEKQHSLCVRPNETSFKEKETPIERVNTFYGAGSLLLSKDLQLHCCLCCCRNMDSSYRCFNYYLGIKDNVWSMKAIE